MESIGDPLDPPDEERERWKRLWSDVGALLLRVSCPNEFLPHGFRDSRGPAPPTRGLSAMGVHC